MMMCCVLFAAQAASAADSPPAKPAMATTTQAGKSVQPSRDPQQQVGDIDSVVAVVNDDVITRYELDDRIHDVVRQLLRQNTPLPPMDVLQKQILERMITDMLQRQYAKETGVRVDDSQLDQAITRIAQQNKFPSLAAFRAKLEADGVNYKKFREEIRSEIISTRLRKREVESKITISDKEVDDYLANKARLGSEGEEFHLAHILVVVPEQASAEKIQVARKRAEQALARINAGADFAQVAASVSDAKDALKGGDLGWRSGDTIPPLFMDQLQKMKPGGTSALLRSSSGFHILKLLGKRSANAPVVITQTHVRHILIKTSEIMPDAEARKRIMEIKQRIEAGADFAEQARRYSQDGSAQQGGDLGWISPGETVPEFEAEMNKLKPGQMGVVQSQFGWHLIQVLARRNADVSEKQKREQARIAIGTFKSDELFQDWLRQLRDRAFIEYHLGPNK
ncbi:MAG: peptidylprolyl isomerase [Gallionella sp.]|nr:peptidylprolyl isomerase [Gallionella sp.]